MAINKFEGHASKAVDQLSTLQVNSKYILGLSTKTTAVVNFVIKNNFFLTQIPFSPPHKPQGYKSYVKI